jgi:hypothetical protein
MLIRLYILVLLSLIASDSFGDLYSYRKHVCRAETRAIPIVRNIFKPARPPRNEAERAELAWRTRTLQELQRAIMASEEDRTTLEALEKKGVTVFRMRRNLNDKSEMVNSTTRDAILIARLYLGPNRELTANKLFKLLHFLEEDHKQSTARFRIIKYLAETYPLSRSLETATYEQLGPLATKVESEISEVEIALGPATNRAYESAFNDTFDEIETNTLPEPLRSIMKDHLTFMTFIELRRPWYSRGKAYDSLRNRFTLLLSHLIDVLTDKEDEDLQ